MAISLYDLSVPNYLQALAAVSGFLDKGLAFCSADGVDPGTIVETRLFDDMMPFRFQIVSVAQHSWGALEAVKGGVFTPPDFKSQFDYAGLQKLVADTRQHIEQLTAADVNSLEGKEVILQLGEQKIPFVAEQFLLSFSLPNFYFHAATAYDILRMKGVKLGKRDFLGRIRFKR